MKQNITAIPEEPTVVYGKQQLVWGPTQKA